MRMNFSILSTVRYFLAASAIFLSTALYAQLQYSAKDVDSLESRLQMPSLTDNEIYVTYQALVQANLHTDFAKSLEYVRKGLLLAEKHKNYFYFCELYFNAGNIHYLLNQLDSTLFCFEQSLAMYEKAVDKGDGNQEDLIYTRMRIFVSMATIHFPSGRYDLVLENYYKALEIAEKENFPEDAAFISMSIADIYKYMSNMGQAETYYLKGEKLYRQLGDSLGIARINYKISGIYNLLEDYPKALQHGEEAYRILSVMPYVRAVDFYGAVQSLSSAWYKIPDYAKALEYALMTVEYARQTNRQDVLAQSLLSLAQSYLKQEKYKEAEETAFRAFAIDSSKLQINTVLYQIIAECNIELKNSAKALKYFHKTMDTKNTFANENFQSSISEMEVRYETEKKEMQIAALNNEKMMLKRQSIAIGGVLLSGLAFLFFLWRWTVQKRRFAESQIRQLEQEKQIVATQAVFDGEVQERTRLARDLHDGMGGKLTVMKIHLEKLKRIAMFDHVKEEQYNVVMDTLNDSVQELRRVSHNLMPDTLIRAGLKPAVDEFCRSMSSQIVFNYYGDETRLDLKLEALIYRSIHELVNNALKYAAASQIMVQIAREPDCISFTVQDNGCGFDATAVTKGMGLQNIRTRVVSFGGDIQIDSNVGVGTEINVELKTENKN